MLPPPSSRSPRQRPAQRLQQQLVPVHRHAQSSAPALDDEAHRVGVSTSALAVALDIGDRQAASMRAGGVPLEVGELVLAVPAALSVAVIGRLLRERLAVDPPADPALAARMTAAASLLV